MSRMCDICSKSSMIVTPRKLLRGNLNPTSKQRKYPNLQTIRFEGGKLRVCTRCLKTLKKEMKKMEEQS